MEKMGHFPLRPDDVRYGADVQQPPHFTSSSFRLIMSCVLITNSARFIFWLPHSHSGQVSFSGLMEASSFAAQGFDTQD